ncbi:unnamed protein product [Tenebrio molitor]|nr:unnamed protein product [Tenebrio molitor]
MMMRIAIFMVLMLSFVALIVEARGVPVIDEEFDQEPSTTASY